LNLVHQHPSIGAALLRLSLAGDAVASQWAISLGRRSAVERCAHLLCELSWRLPRAQNTALQSYTLPLSQDDLGDILGISTVHVNRTLQSLRAQAIISFQNHALLIHDYKALIDIAEFNADYLQL
jgi:CRP-like cAMP-binding protein